MAAIQFAADTIHPVRPNGGRSSEANGVYSTRRASRSSTDRVSLKEAEAIGVGDLEQDGGLQHEGDTKKKQVFTGWMLLWLTYQCNGAIYGDIGTSPLYVYSSTFSSPPEYEDLVGVLSLIIWSLTLMVTVKYVLIVLRADDEGEGGTFALYSLLSRYAHIVKRDPKEESMVKMERHLTTDLKASPRIVRQSLESSWLAKTILKTVGVLGVSLVMSDGVLTPAQSVLGAIQGITVVNPDITTSTVIGISCAILLLLFLLQPLGTTKLAASFAPIVIVWLLLNASFGIYNLVVYDHSVLKAFSPYFAGSYFVRNGTEGWRSLGGVLLAFTGVEALFADLGAFSARAIQLSWVCLAFPCLLLAYIGQAANISVNPDSYSNPFFKSTPPGMLWPSLIIAILAAVVASQAMITATFQLLSQIMKLSYFPQIKVVHTSNIFHGQIYIPFANWLLMIGTIIVTAVYNNTTALGNAYGVCVILVTFITTCMVAIVALIIWRLNPLLVGFGFLAFAALDGVYLSSVLTKVPTGAWFTLALAVFLSAIFILWRFGKEQQWKAEAADCFQPSHLVTQTENGQLKLTPAFGGGAVTRLNGLGIFFDKTGDMTPMIFTQFLSKFVAAPEIMVFFHLRPLSTPSVPVENRYSITRTAIPSCYRLIVRHGYTDEVVTHDLGLLVCEQVRRFIIREGNAAQSQAKSTPPKSSTSSLSESDLVTSRLSALDKAYDSQVLYIVGKEQMRIRKNASIWRAVALYAFLWLRDNTRSKVAAMNVNVDQLVEVGFVKDV